jgi:hypothetical protein
MNAQLNSGSPKEREEDPTSYLDSCLGPCLALAIVCDSLALVANAQLGPVPFTAAKLVACSLLVEGVV